MAEDLQLSVQSARLEMRGLTSNKISIGILVRFSSLPLRFLCRVVWFPSSFARLLRDELALLPVTVPLSMMARRRTPTSLHVIGDRQPKTAMKPVEATSPSQSAY